MRAFGQLARRQLRTTSLCARNITTTAKNLGITEVRNKGKIFRNLSFEEIAEHEKVQGSGNPDMYSDWTDNGVFCVDTGKFTGRSPKDKWIVKQAPSEDQVWWGEVNQPITSDVFEELHQKALAHYEQTEDLYVFDGFCGSQPATQKKVRFVTEMAWQHHFVTNMFIRGEGGEVGDDFAPDFTIYNACKVIDEDWKAHGLNSEVFVAFNIEKRVAIIGGTWYGGEMKKGIFSMMNYWLPQEGILPMHCSANKGDDGVTALFFGLSGTGKTTLSADPKRELIGDDEHGWSDTGIFNFEGGCYAKTLNLREEDEPEIFRAIRPNALLENVVLNEQKHTMYEDDSKTANSRVSYPIEHIPNFEPTLSGGHPRAVIFLTCDAYGVLPPVSKLTSGQAMYHFLSGYTAKVAGTERGILEPEATFSACFGAAFLTLHPTRYAELLKEKLEKFGANAYLVNTGWSGGAYGTGKRMKIGQTRACIDSILDGSIENATFAEHPTFGFGVPDTIAGVPSDVLNARASWEDKDAYDRATVKLASMFAKNFAKYTTEGHDYSEFGPKF